MTAVSSTTTNVGSKNDSVFQAKLTSGVSDFQIATSAGSVSTIQQSATFVQTDTPFTMAAPLTDNIIGQTFGAAFIDPGRTGNFSQASIFKFTIPVILTQFAGNSIILGGIYTISSVPLPVPFWLFGSGLPGLVDITKRKLGYV